MTNTRLYARLLRNVASSDPDPLLPLDRDDNRRRLQPLVDRNSSSRTLKNNGDASTTTYTGTILFIPTHHGTVDAATDANANAPTCDATYSVHLDSSTESKRSKAG